jgi:hypothetical protein
MRVRYVADVGIVIAGDLYITVHNGARFESVGISFVNVLVIEKVES